MSLLVHIADRALNRPLLITREKAQVVMSVLSGRIGITAPDASRFVGDAVERDEDGRAVRGKPYRVANGVGIITITGSLVNRGAWIGASSGLTSYEGIGHQVKTALTDDAVQSVILDMETPGGEAVGAFETAELVRQLSAKKKTVALVNGMAASAGYAIASAAGEIVTTETGISGSIGVVMVHADYSRMLANEGIEPTLIFAGAHKVDGNPFEPLPADVRSDLQAEVEAFYDLFIKTVAKGRGARLTAAGARKTEARVFIGQRAVDAGIADRVGSFETLLSELSRARSGRSTSQPRSMSMSENRGAPDADTTGTIAKADHDAAVRAAETRGHEAGVAAERVRLAAALAAEGVKGDSSRMAAALDLAAKSPAMSGTDIAAFVVANVGASKPAGETQHGHDDRVGASGLAKPDPNAGAASAAQTKAGWASAFKRTSAQ